jgi:hypothetical protein
MSGIVQHKSAVANGNRHDPALTLDSPVTAGNLILVVSGADPSADLVPYDDSQGNSYQNALSLFGPSVVGIQIRWAIAKASGTLSFSSSQVDGDSSSEHLHVYEISQYNTADASGTNFQSGTASGTVSTSGAKAQAAEFVLGVFASDSGSPTFTLGGGLVGEHTTGDDGVTVASGGAEVNSAGVQTETASASGSGNITSVIVTFYNVAPPPPPPPPPSSGIFLGSVTEVGSIPSGAAAIFVGTVTVVESAPAGVPNPYLGRIHSGSPSAGQANPSLGQVVIVGSAPAGAHDPYLGTVEKA